MKVVDVKPLCTIYNEKELSKDEREWSDRMVDMLMTARKHVRLRNENNEISKKSED